MHLDGSNIWNGFPAVEWFHMGKQSIPGWFFPTWPENEANSRDVNINFRFGTFLNMIPIHALHLLLFVVSFSYAGSFDIIDHKVPHKPYPPAGWTSSHCSHHRLSWTALWQWCFHTSRSLLPWWASMGMRLRGYPPQGCRALQLTCS